MCVNLSLMRRNREFDVPSRGLAVAGRPLVRIPISARAFTLIELILVVAVVAALMAILLPALAGVKRAADQVRTMAAMRELGAALSAYVYDHDWSYPYYGTSGVPSDPLRINGVEYPMGSGASYFRMYSPHWVSGVTSYLSGIPADGGYSILSGEGLEKGDLRNPLGAVRCRFWMTHTAFADRAFWTDAGPHLPEYLVRARANQVRHPARKGMLLDIDWPGRPSPGDTTFVPEKVAVAMADGSVKAQPGYARSFEPLNTLPFTIFDSFPIMATRDGLSGFDY